MSEETHQGGVQIRQFQYHPLDTTRGEIRLLRASPPTGPLPIGPASNYKLFHTPLNDAPDFVALSYCWGDNALECQVTINGQPMHVTRSLKIALDNLGDAEQDVLLWADAICINQNDPVEKTTQVQLMRDIYRTASRVILWLGPSTLETHDTVREMCKLGDQLMELGLWNLRTDDYAHWTVSDEDTSSIACTKRKVLRLHAKHIERAQSGDDPFWWVGSGLGKRDWFYVGAILEGITYAILNLCSGYGASRNAQTLESRHSAVALTRLISPVYFAMFWNMDPFNPSGDEQYRKILKWKMTLTSAIAPILIGIRWRYLVIGELDLRTLLLKTNINSSPTSRIGATDPRDRVYALLGIANDASAKGFIADYTLSCKQAYIMTARTLLQHGHDDILSLCRTRGECKDLPSWVPDWTAYIRMPWTTWYAHKDLFNAGEQLNGAAAFTVASNPKDRFSTMISVNGTFIDTIQDIGHALCYDADSNVDWVNSRHHFQDIRTYLASSTKYTETQKEEAEWRIPIGDTDARNTTNQTFRATATSAMRTGYAVAKVVAKMECRSVETSEYTTLGPFAVQLSGIYDSRPFISKSGYVGLCPLETQPGDAIAILKGARVPYVVRRAEDLGGWTLIGESHVYGIMDGEFMTTNPPMEEIVLC